MRSILIAGACVLGISGCGQQASVADLPDPSRFGDIDLQQCIGENPSDIGNTLDGWFCSGDIGVGVQIVSADTPLENFFRSGTVLFGVFNRERYGFENVLDRAIAGTSDAAEGTMFDNPESARIGLDGVTYGSLFDLLLDSGADPWIAAKLCDQSVSWAIEDPTADVEDPAMLCVGNEATEERLALAFELEQLITDEIQEGRASEAVWFDTHPPEAVVAVLLDSWLAGGLAESELALDPAGAVASLEAAFSSPRGWRTEAGQDCSLGLHAVCQVTVDLVGSDYGRLVELRLAQDDNELGWVTAEAAIFPQGTSLVPAEEAEELAEPGPDESTPEPIVWTTGPDGSFGSGCSPGTSDSLPDGTWAGFVEVRGDQIGFDLVCHRWVDTGEGLEEPVVENNNPALRWLAPAPGLVVSDKRGGGGFERSLSLDELAVSYMSDADIDRVVLIRVSGGTVTVLELPFRS